MLDNNLLVWVGLTVEALMPLYCCKAAAKVNTIA